MRSSRMAAAALTAAALGIGLLPAASPAEVIVKGTGEPAFTSSANNTQWVEWSNNGQYRIEFNHHVNGGNAVVDGPYAVAMTGSTSVNWSGIRGTSVPLQEGSTYTICGFGRWNDGTGMYFPDFSTSCGDADRRGLRASTTIDRTAPTIGVALAGGKAAVKSAGLPLRVDFADNLAGPFPANFLCVQYGAVDASGLCNGAQGYKYVEQPACSQPKSPGKSTAFECTVDVAGGTPAPDGEVHVCVMAADAAIPDNPTSADQRASSTSANRSAPKCDTVLLDRVAPTLAIDAPATAHVGDLVSVGAQASDATSGLTGSYAWSWGDNTAAGSGQVASHTFTAPGTYELTVETTDAAGNAATAKRTVTVTAKPQPQPQPQPEPDPKPQPTPTPTPTPEDPGDVIGDPVDDADEVTLTVKAPRTLALSKAKGLLPFSFTADAPGRATIVLKRGSRRLVQGTARLAAEGRKAVRLRLPKGAKAGAHKLTVAFASDEGDELAVTRTVAFTGKGAKASAARMVAAPAGRVLGASLDPVLPDGRYHGPAGTRARLR